MYFLHLAIEINLVSKRFGHSVIDPASSLIPGLHGSCCFNIKKIEVACEHRRRHVEDIGCHQEVYKERLEYLVPEIAGKSANVEQCPHAHIVKRIQHGDQL